MRTVWSIFKHDARALMRNPFALIVVLAVIVLPAAFAWYSVTALWNPYSHADSLKIAVVNNDAGVSTEQVREKAKDGVDAQALEAKLAGANTLNVGELVVGAVKENGGFDWQFVIAEQGEEGLASGEYYAEFVLPENLTESFLSALTDSPEKPVIEYRVNEKQGVAPVDAADEGSGAVEAIVNREFSTAATSSLAGALEEVAGSLLAKTKGASAVMSTGLDGAEQDVEVVETNLARAKESAGKYKIASDEAKKALDSLKETAPALRESVDEAEKVLADARAAAHEVSSAYGSAMAKGDQGLADILADASSKVTKALEPLGANRETLDSELEQAEKALKSCEKSVAALKKADPDSPSVSDLEEECEELSSRIANLRKASKSIGEAANSADAAAGDLSSQADKALGDLKGRADTFNEEILPELDTSLDTISVAMGTLDAVLGSLDAQIKQAKTLLENMDKLLQEIDASVDASDEFLGVVHTDLSAARSDVAALANAKAVQEATSAANFDPSSYAMFAVSPIKTQVEQVYPLNSYGSGVAPFYMSLALWVGCFMLILVLKLDVNTQRYRRMRSWQGYLGRLSLFGLISLLQGLVIAVGAIIAGVQTTSIVAFIMASVVSAFCFMNIVYALAVTFKHVGKALALVLLIVQIPSALGVYPAQLVPEILRPLQQWLPITYSMGAIREAIGGFYSLAYARDVLWLIACGMASLGLALFVRPRVLNLNRLFDHKLKQGSVFITLEHGMNSDADVDSAFARAVKRLFEDEGERALLLLRARKFAQRYVVVRNSAPLAVVTLVAALVIVSLLLPLTPDEKLIALATFIAAIFIVFLVCLVFENMYDSMTMQLASAGVNLKGLRGANQVAQVPVMDNAEGVLIAPPSGEWADGDRWSDAPGDAWDSPDVEWAADEGAWETTEDDDADGDAGGEETASGTDDLEANDGDELADDGNELADEGEADAEAASEPQQRDEREEDGEGADA